MSGGERCAVRWEGITDERAESAGRAEWTPPLTIGVGRNASALRERTSPRRGNTPLPPPPPMPLPRRKKPLLLAATPPPL